MLLISLNNSALAEGLSGRSLAQLVFDRDRGMDSVSSAQMILVDQNGNKKTRRFTNKRIVEDDLERQIIRFTSPADINGTGFLTIEIPGWDTEQFIFLPALRRTRRIVSSQKGHRFVNSDFSYEDMQRQPVDDYTYKIVGIQTVGKLKCHSLEARPKQKTGSQYSLIQSLISIEGLVPILIKYFDKKGAHSKTYKVLKLEQIQGIWTEMTVSMEDLSRSHKTYINIDKILYNTGIDPEQVSRKRLEDY